MVVQGLVGKDYTTSPVLALMWVEKIFNLICCACNQPIPLTSVIWLNIRYWLSPRAILRETEHSCGFWPMPIPKTCVYFLKSTNLGKEVEDWWVPENNATSLMWSVIGVLNNQVQITRYLYLDMHRFWSLWEYRILHEWALGELKKIFTKAPQRKGPNIAVPNRSVYVRTFGYNTTCRRTIK